MTQNSMYQIKSNFTAIERNQAIFLIDVSLNGSTLSKVRDVTTLNGARLSLSRERRCGGSAWKDY